MPDTPRRQFLRTLSGLAGATLAGTSLNPLQAEILGKRLGQFHHTDPEEAARDEDFWALVQQAFTASPTFINLNSGGVSPHPRVVEEAVERHTHMANEAPAYYMWRQMERQRKVLRRELASLAGVKPTEVAIQRNATEALETAILGLDLKRGDEILTTNQDYPSMISTLKQRSRREGINIKYLSLPVPAEDFGEIIRRFADAITPRTRAILLCHVVNLSGQILPVKEICALARERNIRTIVDGAHSFANLPFRISDLGCDFFGTSLHKWLCAPFGTGMLYVREALIPSLWPLHGAPEGEEKRIEKFEHLGTRSIPIELGISTAIRFHQYLGADRKWARLQYLKTYWTERAKSVPGLRFHSSLNPAFACGMTNISLEQIPARQLGTRLLSQYQIYTTTTNHEDIKGVRISPNVFTTLPQLDHLVDSLKQLATAKD